MIEVSPSPFASHILVESLVTETFGTWRCLRPHADGGYDSTLGFRVVAADARLTVTGDFDPCVFAYGPANPLACLRWVATMTPGSRYAVEKATIGLGSGRAVVYDVEAAREDLTRLRDDAREERVKQAQADEGVDDATWVQALNDALDDPPDYDGVYGVHEWRVDLLDKVEHDYSYVELISELGERPHPSVALAVQACSRLLELLTALAAEPSISLALIDAGLESLGLVDGEKRAADPGQPLGEGDRCDG